jgi:hypothetical protein
LKSSASPLAELQSRLPELRGFSEAQALELADEAVARGVKGARDIVRFVGQVAEERGCASKGPVEVAAGTWAYRSAGARTYIWHRKPTASEVRALTGDVRTSHTARSVRRPSAPTARRTLATERVGRIF